MIVVLSRQEVAYATEVGAKRKAMHRYAAYDKQKRPDLNQQRGGEDLNPWDEVEGANAEFAVAKVTRRFWPGDWWNKEKTVDVPPDIEVRHTRRNDGHLLLYNGDNQNYRYVLVIGQIPEFCIVGYTFGKHGFKEEYLRCLRDGRPPAFFVPQSALLPIEDLLINWNAPSINS